MMSNNEQPQEESQYQKKAWLNAMQPKLLSARTLWHQLEGWPRDNVYDFCYEQAATIAIIERDSNHPWLDDTSLEELIEAAKRMHAGLDLTTIPVEQWSTEHGVEEEDDEYGTL